MNNYEFIEKAKQIAAKNTRYAKGTFGQSKSILAAKQKQYPSWYSVERMKSLQSAPNDTKYFDCIGLIKWIHWTNDNGTTIYTSNGVPDYDETTFFNKCTNKSTDFSKVEDGELVWMTGHIGIVVDASKGLVVEATNAWESKVLYSSWIKGNAPHYRKWTKHGKNPYITYIKKELFQVMTEHALVEAWMNYNPVKLITGMKYFDIVEVKDNFGKTSEGFWIDLTKCRRVTK